MSYPLDMLPACLSLRLITDTGRNSDGSLAETSALVRQVARLAAQFSEADAARAFDWLISLGESGRDRERGLERLLPCLPVARLPDALDAVLAGRISPLSRPDQLIITQAAAA